ncbi:MAG: serine hydrolase domain-containing protein, partial [Vicinamibacterales bacterium]
IVALALLASACAAANAPPPAGDRHPKTIDEFKAAVQQVLDDTGVPGAGIALVRLGGVEWAGGVGFADRDARTPVTADTHFRAGSISKTFVAIALVQLYEDGEIDLDTPVAELASDVEIDNAWMISDPVRLIHLLQHTAGLDDMHFNEIYNQSYPPDLPLAEVLKLNPSSRVVRWPPGTRMSYSNPGYGIAGHILERLTGQKYEDRIAEEIFKPIGMTESSFHLAPDDHAKLAKGYSSRGGPAVAYTPIYLRPAGNLHTSAGDMGKFVQLLLNWGETATDLVVDPEYLSNMEHPRTSLASAAGLRNGYGTGLASSFVEGFPMLGHNGGIEGFSSSFAYSTSRDVGYVVLLNSTHSPEAMRRISRLAVRYLKANVEAPPKPEAQVGEAVLREYEGYYHQANPRHQVMAFVEWLRGGQQVRVNGSRLEVAPVFGPATTLIPVSNNLFRLDADPEASRVFTTDVGGTMVLTGGSLYLERRPRWHVDVIRWPVLISLVILLTPSLMAVPWLLQGLSRRLVRRSAEREGGSAKREGGWLKLSLLGCSAGLILPAIGFMNAGDTALGTRNLWTIAIFTGSILVPTAAILSSLFTVEAFMSGAGRWLKTYAVVTSIAALIVAGYLSAWGMLAFTPWNF